MAEDQTRHSNNSGSGRSERRDYGRVAFGLSGGAAKGYGLIGAIRALEELGIRPDIIAGTSAGAMIGGLYATGMSPDEIEDRYGALSQAKVMSMVDVEFRNAAIVAGNRVEEFLLEMIGDVRIEDLPVKYVATAVDVLTGRGYYIDRGPLIDAIRASISIPGIFAPVRANGGYLVDGGVRERLPLRILPSYDPDFIVAVNIAMNTRLDSRWVRTEIKRTRETRKGLPELFGAVVDRFISNALNARRKQAGADSEAPSDSNQAHGKQRLRFARLVANAYAIFTDQEPETLAALTKPNLRIDLNMDSLALWEFWRAHEGARIGYEQALPVIEEFVSTYGNLDRLVAGWRKLTRPKYELEETN